MCSGEQGCSGDMVFVVHSMSPLLQGCFGWNRVLLYLGVSHSSDTFEGPLVYLTDEL